MNDIFQVEGGGGARILGKATSATERTQTLGIGFEILP